FDGHRNRTILRPFYTCRRRTSGGAPTTVKIGRIVMSVNLAAMFLPYRRMRHFAASSVVPPSQAFFAIPAVTILNPTGGTAARHSNGQRCIRARCEEVL